MGATDPYSRQRRLAEIGERGQSRLLTGRFSPSADLGPAARSLSVRYARAAGYGAIGEASESRPPRLASHFRHAAAADVGLGAADVLSQALPLFDLRASEK